MKRLFAFISVLTVMIGCVFVTAAAYGEDNDYSDGSYRVGNAYLKDEAEIFSDTMSRELFDSIRETADSIGMNVGVYIGGTYRSDSATRKFASESSELIFGNGEDVSSVFLYLDFEGGSSSYDYIDTFHDAQLYITYSDIDDIIDDMYEYLPKSGETVYDYKVIEAIKVFLNDLVKEKNGGADHSACYYNEEKNKYRYVFFGNIMESSIKPYRFVVLFSVLGIIAAVVAAVLSGQRIRKKYKFRLEQKVSSYTSDNRIIFKDRKDIFLGSHVSKVKIQSENGGSHGGSSHGGSHGGGGGHR